MEPTAFHYLAISAAMFSLGVIGVLTRRNAVNLSLVTFSRLMNDADGSMLVFFVMCVAAAEAVVGLAIIISMFRNKQNIDINNFNLFKW